MKNNKLYRIPLSLAILAVAALLAQPAQAEEKSGEAPAAATERKGEGRNWGGHKKPGEGQKTGRMMMAPEDLDKIEGMTAEERRAYFKDKRAAFEKMSPEERKAAKEKRRAAFEALSDEQKQALRERNKKVFEKIKAERKAHFDSLSPEEQEKIKARMKEKRGDWKKDGEGRKRGGKPDNAPEPTAAE